MKALIFLPIVFISIINTKAADTLVVKQSLIYDNDAADLTESHKLELLQKIRLLADYNSFSIAIMGYADANGSEQYNQQLSKKRADGVYAFLIQNKVEAARLNRFYYGEKFAKNEDDMNALSKYRRVDIIISLVKYTQTSELLKAIADDYADSRKIKADSAYRLIGKHGTQFDIEPQSFVFEDGTPCTSSIEFNFQEAVDPLSILSLGLVTTSDDMPLFTRGMVFVEAKSNGQSLAIAEGKEIAITLPSIQNTTEQMNVFYGENTADGKVNWKIDTAKQFEKKVKVFPLNIEKSALAKIFVPQLETSVLPKMAYKLSLPKIPVKPYIARVPSEPSRNTYKYIPTDLEKVFLSRKQLAAKDEEVFKKATENYEKRLAVYQTRKENFEVAMTNYEIAMQHYSKDSAEFVTKLNERLEELATFFKSFEKRDVGVRLNQLKNKLMQTDFNTQTRARNIASSYNYAPASLNRIEIIEKDLGKELLAYVWKTTPLRLVNMRIRHGKNKVYENNWRVDYDIDVFRDSLMRVSGLTKFIATTDAAIMDSLAKMGLLRAGMFDGYVASVSKMGWINCDRFYNVPVAQKVAPMVAESEDATIYLILKNQAVFLKLNKTANGYTSMGVPRKESYKIVAIKLIDGKPLYAFKDLNSMTDKPIKLEYETAGFDRLKREMNTLQNL